jgi:hypothetical protein
MKHGIYGLIILLLLSGCSTMKVAADFSQAADFSNFRTFQFKESDMTMAEINPFVHQRIVDAIKREMVAQSFTEVDSNPDVYITYYSKLSEQFVINTTSSGYTHGQRWHQLRWQWGDGGMRRMNTTTTATTYTRGTLVIDMWDAGQQQLVRRGTVSDAISESPEENTELIIHGVSKVFEKYPPTTS